MSISHGFDLAAYGERVGYAGPFEPTLPVLHALAERHATRFGTGERAWPTE